MVAPKNFSNRPIKEVEKGVSKTTIFLLLIGISGALLFLFKGVDFIKINKDGNVVLSEERQERLERELEELENAEQYALRVVVSGYYPCYSCEGEKIIHLFTGEIWKYGVTTKGEKGRYPNGLPAEGLYYDIQLEANFQTCLMEEKRKLFNYSTLPENLKREIPIIRPPGNKIDR